VSPHFLILSHVGTSAEFSFPLRGNPTEAGVIFLPNLGEVRRSFAQA